MIIPHHCVLKFRLNELHNYVLVIVIAGHRLVSKCIQTISLFSSLLKFDIILKTEPAGGCLAGPVMIAVI